MRRIAGRWRWITILTAFAVILAGTLYKLVEGTNPLLRAYGQPHRLHAWAVGLASPLWTSRLYTPTLLTKIDSLYFIVDCWHNRVIYSSNLDLPLSKWKTLDDTLAGPHSIASDAVLYVVEDTGRNSIRVYTHERGGFQLVQIVPDLGTRTHRTRYDPATSAFYVLSSDSQRITKLVRQGDRLQVVYTKVLPFLGHAYTRSFIILDGFMYFASGPGSITKTRYVDDSYAVIDSYPVPQIAIDMDDLFQSGRYIYITATPGVMIRAQSFEDLRRGQWENIYGSLKLRGTPYFLSEFDGRIFVPQIRTYSGIQSFAVHDGAIHDVRTLNNSGPPTRWDVQVQSLLPK